MEIFLTCIIIEGVTFYMLNKENLREQEIIQRWKTGNLTYENVQKLKLSKYVFLHRMNKNIAFGKDPGYAKKND